MPNNLISTIARFEADCELAHQLVNGGPTAEILTENGLVPSFSKMMADYQAKIAQLDTLINNMSGSVVKRYQFESSLLWRVKHDMGTTSFVQTITNSDGVPVYANVVIVDDTEFFVEFTAPEAGEINVVFRVGNTPAP